MIKASPGEYVFAALALMGFCFGLWRVIYYQWKQFRLDNKQYEPEHDQNNSY